MKKTAAILVLCMFIMTTVTGCNYVASARDVSPEMKMKSKDVVDPIVVKPISYGTKIDFRNLKDGVYNVSFDAADITEREGKYFVRMEFYQEDLYDSIELSCLRPGDSVYVDGIPVCIDSVDDRGGRFSFNGGVENAGADFKPTDGGLYRYYGLDDSTSYTNKGSKEMELSNKIRILDNSDPVDCPEGKIISEEDAFSFLLNEDVEYCQYNTTIIIKDGVVSEIVKGYMP